MSHRSEVLSDQQWDTIAPIVSCLKAFFGSYAQVPVDQIYRTHTLARQPVGLDDVVGKKTGLGYGCDVR